MPFIPQTFNSFSRNLLYLSRKLPMSPITASFDIILTGNIVRSRTIVKNYFIEFKFFRFLPGCPQVMPGLFGVLLIKLYLLLSGLPFHPLSILLSPAACFACLQANRATGFFSEDCFINLPIHSLFQMVMFTLFIHPFGNIFYESIRDYLHPLTLTISIIKLKTKSVAVPE